MSDNTENPVVQMLERVTEITDDPAVGAKLVAATLLLICDGNKEAAIDVVIDTDDLIRIMAENNPVTPPDASVH